MNRRQHGARSADHARGQAMVEFALASILLLAGLLGFFDVARGIAAHQAVSEMAWAGVRYASAEACLGQRYSGGASSTGREAGRDEHTATCPRGASSARAQHDSGLQPTLTPEQQAAIEARAPGRVRDRRLRRDRHRRVSGPRDPAGPARARDRHVCLRAGILAVSGGQGIYHFDE